jgi:hypothetical protein
MKKSIAMLIFGGFVFLNSAISAPVIIYAPKKPPVAKVVKVGPTPYKHSVWVSGHWIWNGHSYIWVNGFWTKPRPGKVWIEGHWIKKPCGWIYVDGHWR